MNRTLTPDDLKVLLSDGSLPMLLDVRRKADYDADPRRIPGARWQDPEAVKRWAETLSSTEEIVLYCVRGGSVSNAVLDHLRERSLNARYLEGGITAWKQAGSATEGD